MRLKAPPPRPPAPGPEGGSALVMAIIVISVLMLLGAASTEMAVHTVASSARGRDRVAAAHAAEAGVNDALKELSAATGAAWCGVTASPSTVLPGGGGAPGGQQYAVTVTDSNPADGPCTAADPMRLVVATGYAPRAGAPGALTRRMEAQVRMLPQVAAPSGFGWDKAIFNSSPTTDVAIANSTTLLGSGAGDDANVYTGKGAPLANTVAIHGNLIAQDDVTVPNNTNIYGDIIAAGDVSIPNSATIYGNVVSATGSVTIDNHTIVTGYIRAATTISLSGNWQVGSTTAPGPCPATSCLANSPSTPPPVETLPDFTWNASDPLWPQPVTTWTSCTAFSAWIVLNKDDFRGTHRISPACGLTLSNNVDVTLTGDAAIVSDGWVRFENSFKFKEPAGGHWKLFVISFHQPGGTDPERGIEIDNSASFQPPTLFFTRNKFTKKNSGGITGQIYADRVYATNAFVLQFAQVVAPGFTVSTSTGASAVTGYRTELLYLRET